MVYAILFFLSNMHTELSGQLELMDCSTLLILGDKIIYLKAKV